MSNPDEIFEYHVPTPAELAGMIKMLREDKKWSQATLAEISRLTERTIQRVENKEPSSVDTRRALAGALGFDDLDIFNNPLPFPDMEKVKAHSEHVEKTTAVVALTLVEKGRTVRVMVEGTSAAAIHELGEHTDVAQETFAAIVEYLHDYNDMRECYSMTQRLGVDRDIDELLTTLAGEGSALGAGLRNAKVRSSGDAPGMAAMDWTNIHLVLAPKSDLPSSIRVQKSFSLA